MLSKSQPALPPFHQNPRHKCCFSATFMAKALNESPYDEKTPSKKMGPLRRLKVRM
jgi:hypothetical protein